MRALPCLPRLPGLPSQCALCHGWGWSRLCSDCLHTESPPRHRCRRCALVLPSSIEVCGQCVTRAPAHDAALVAFDYAVPWSHLIARFKFHDGLELSDALAARLLAAHVARGEDAPVLMLPVPLSPQRLQERGYNQAWELVRRIAPSLGAVAAPSLLLRVRDTAQQAAMPLSDRRVNVLDAFAVDPHQRHRLQGHSVTVVDDVMTTGATFEEIARVLKAAGAARVEVWALARTPAPSD